MTNGQAFIVGLAVVLYLAATVYVKLSKPGGIIVAIVGALLLIVDEPAEAK